MSSDPVSLPTAAPDAGEMGEGWESDQTGPVERDLGRAELLSSSAVQNSFAVSPLLSILMVPLANGLTALQGAFRRWRRR